jgi:hypothetical protein
MVSPTRGETTAPKTTMARPASTMVTVWPRPHRTPTRAALPSFRSRLTMVVTAITWSGSVAWRIPRTNPKSAMGRK